MTYIFKNISFEQALDQLVTAVLNYHCVTQSEYIQIIWRMGVKLDSHPKPSAEEDPLRVALKAALLRAMADHWREAPKLRIDERAPDWTFDVEPVKEFFNVCPEDAVDPFDPRDWNEHFKALNLYAVSQFVFFV